MKRVFAGRFPERHTRPCIPILRRGEQKPASQGRGTRRPVFDSAVTFEWQCKRQALSIDRREEIIVFAARRAPGRALKNPARFCTVYSHALVRSVHPIAADFDKSIRAGINIVKSS